MPVPAQLGFFVDPHRCIGCEACIQACSECDTHKGTAMIHLEYVDRATSPQTAPVICMHCDSPTCAEVCPADAIKRTPDGIVQSAKKERCVGCNHCGLACPFGVPKVEVTGIELMMKCDMCYDRTSEGLKPMCASVCPSQCLFFGTTQEIEQLRPRSKPLNQFQFGQQTINTKVNMLVPINDAEGTLNVTDELGGRSVEDMMMAGLFEEDLTCPQNNQTVRRRATRLEPIQCPALPTAKRRMPRSGDSISPLTLQQTARARGVSLWEVRRWPVV